MFRVIFFYLYSFFFNDTATTQIYTLSLHDALPIPVLLSNGMPVSVRVRIRLGDTPGLRPRSEEHTSELQSRPHLVCRLLLEKKKKKKGSCLNKKKKRKKNNKI